MKQIKIFSIITLSIIFIIFLVNFVLGYNNSTTQTTEGNKISYIVENDGEIECGVRVKICLPSTVDWFAEGWHDGGDSYFYFLNPLQPNESSSPLEVNISDIPSGLNITAIVESIPITYTPDGSAIPADPVSDWTIKAYDDEGGGF